jgi:hypothetical protein
MANRDQPRAQQNGDAQCGEALCHCDREHELQPWGGKRQES